MEYVFRQDISFLGTQYKKGQVIKKGDIAPHQITHLIGHGSLEIKQQAMSKETKVKSNGKKTKAN